MFVSIWFLLRCDIYEKTESREEFLISFSRDFPELVKHDFLTNSQAEAFVSIGNNLKDGEFLVGLDFSMNYTPTV